VRHDWIRQTNSNYRTNIITKQSPSATPPRAAFTFAPSDSFSAYVSWGKSFRFNQGMDAASNAFAPERGEAWEGGVKYALADGRLNGTLSLFRITKDNMLVNDPDSPDSGFQIAAGQARSKGVEFDLNWQMTPQFSFTAVYALTDTKITRDTRSALLGSALSNVPKHSGALYGYWQSNGSEPGSVSIGGGITYVGSRPGDDANSGFRLPDYVTARANLAWQVSPAVSLHLDADNLFDAYYLESSYSDVWITPGAPRTVKGRIRIAI
jgi:iron complex outermembrane receptor protein